MVSLSLFCLSVLLWCGVLGCVVWLACLVLRCLILCCLLVLCFLVLLCSQSLVYLVLSSLDLDLDLLDD
jgi:hypothetical protein